MISWAIAQAIEWSLATPRISPFLPSNSPIAALLSLAMPRWPSQAENITLYGRMLNFGRVAKPMSRPASDPETEPISASLRQCRIRHATISCRPNDYSEL